MLSILLPLYIATTPPPPVYTWCTFQMRQINSREMILLAYGMGNVPKVN
jgi:hypothetical protein